MINPSEGAGRPDVASMSEALSNGQRTCWRALQKEHEHRVLTERKTWKRTGQSSVPTYSALFLPVTDTLGYLKQQELSRLLRGARSRTTVGKKVLALSLWGLCGFSTRLSP